MKILSVGAELLHVKRQTNNYYEADSRSQQFGTATKT